MRTPIIFLFAVMLVVLPGGVVMGEPDKARDKDYEDRRSDRDDRDRDRKPTVTVETYAQTQARVKKEQTAKAVARLSDFGRALGVISTDAVRESFEAFAKSVVATVEAARLNKSVSGANAFGQYPDPKATNIGPTDGTFVGTINGKNIYDEKGSAGGTSSTGLKCVSTAGQACSKTNECRATATGSRTCLGICSVGAPALPTHYSQTCTSAANVCGMQKSGTHGCNIATCSAQAPSDNDCPTPLEDSQVDFKIDPNAQAGPIPQVAIDPLTGKQIRVGGITNPPSGKRVVRIPTREGCQITKDNLRECSKDFSGSQVGSIPNTACTVLKSRGHIGCDGQCKAVVPGSEFCTYTPPASTKTITCSSLPNSCGLINTITTTGLRNTGDCPVVATPSESTCGNKKPIFGLRTIDGRTTVSRERPVVLVWDTIRHATVCTIAGRDWKYAIASNPASQDRTTVPWVNVIPSGSVQAVSVTSITEFTMDCYNGTNGPYRETLRLTPLPEIKEK